jgi:hypothetical protein
LNTHVFNHLESVTKLHVFNHFMSVAKPQVFYYLVSDAKIFDIIYQLSPLWSVTRRFVSPRKVRSPRVTLPFSGRQTVRSHSNKGDNYIFLLIIWDSQLRLVSIFQRYYKSVVSFHLMIIITSLQICLGCGFAEGFSFQHTSHIVF